MSLEISNVLDVYSKIANHFSSTRFSKWSWITSFLDNFSNNSYL